MSVVPYYVISNGPISQQKANWQTKKNSMQLDQSIGWRCVATGMLKLVNDLS